MFLKILIYSIAIWFFIRIIRRVAKFWFGVSSNRTSERPISNNGAKQGSKRIDDVEDAVFTEVDDNR